MGPIRSSLEKNDVKFLSGKTKALLKKILCGGDCASRLTQGATWKATETCSQLPKAPLPHSTWEAVGKESSRGPHPSEGGGSQDSAIRQMSPSAVRVK